MKKIKIASAALLFLALWLYGVCPSQAEGIPTIYEAEQAFKSATVDVRIKVEVPEGFSGTVTLEYTGKDTEGFTAVLNKEDDYTTIIALPRDLYTYKQHSVVSGYDVRVAKNFLLDEATINLNNTYLLPVIVSKADSEENQNNNYVTAKIYASPQDCDFNGEIEITYSGTNGNSFIVTLNSSNEYTVEIPILSDLYTLSNLSVSKGYEVNTLYSFNVLDAKVEQKYQMAVKVYGEGQNPTKKEEKTFIMKQVIFQADIPEFVDFTGDINISYTGSLTYPFQVTLTKSENYTKTVEIPIDTYEFDYAVSYDDLRYTFDSKKTFTLGEGNEFQNITISILQDGQLIRQAEEIKEEIRQEQPAVEKKTGDLGQFIIIILLIVAFICFFSYKTFFNGKKNSEKEEKETEFPLDELEEEMEETEDDDNLDDFL